MQKFTLKIFFYFFILTGLVNCEKDSEMQPAGPVEPLEDELLLDQLMQLEALGVDAEIGINDLIFPNGSTIQEWNTLNDPDHTSTFSRVKAGDVDQRELFIARMTKAGMDLMSMEVTGQPNGLAYLFGSQFTKEASTWPGAKCQRDLVGLDGSGMIFQMCRASKLNLADVGTTALATTDTWNSAFASSPDFTGIEMISLMNLSVEQFRHGDLVVVPGVYIGMVFKTATKTVMLNSIGHSTYACEKNSDASHGPVFSSNATNWITSLNKDYHVLRPTQDITNTTWTAHMIADRDMPSWNAELVFYADGTVKYDEPDFPGVYLSYGKWKLDGISLKFDIGRGDNYQFQGILSSTKIDGLYFYGGLWHSWNATLKGSALPEPQPDRIICPGEKIPINWVIISREPCISCPGGNTCRQSIIRDLSNRPKGYEVKICPGSVVPADYDQDNWTEPCTGQCADAAGSACVMRFIRKR